MVAVAYIEWGINFISKLNGMFAIALFDIDIQKIILTRDKLGIKPLYYTIYRKELIFSSEIKAILKAGVKKRAKLQSVKGVLNYSNYHW